MASDCKPIPPDIIFDIFSRLRVRELCRLRCVSKSWRALISDPVFQQNHLRICERNPILFVTTIDDAQSQITTSLLDKESRTLDPVTQFTLKEGYDLPASYSFTSMDLVCIHDGSHNVYICNPLTKKWIHLTSTSTPRTGEISTLHLELGYVASTSTYKVFRAFAVSDPRRPDRGYNRRSRVKFEVLALGSNRWRAVEGPHVDARFRFGMTGIAIDGSVYLLWEDIRSNRVVTVFDLKEEAWSVVPVPPVHAGPRSMMAMGGQLCLAYWCDTRIGFLLESWLLKGLDENRPVWEKGRSIDILTPAYQRASPLAFDQETGKIFLHAVEGLQRWTSEMPCTYELLRYDPKNPAMEDIYSGKSNFTAGFYIESFRSLDVKGFNNAHLQSGEWISN